MVTYKGRKISNWHLFVYQLMKQKATNKVFINYPIAKEVINRRFQKLPKFYLKIILREMEELKLIKQVGRRGHMVFEFTAKDLDKKLNPIIID